VRCCDILKHYRLTHVSSNRTSKSSNIHHASVTNRQSLHPPTPVLQDAFLRSIHRLHRIPHTLINLQQQVIHHPDRRHLNTNLFRLPNNISCYTNQSDIPLNRKVGKILTTKRLNLHHPPRPPILQHTRRYRRIAPRHFNRALGQIVRQYDAHAPRYIERLGRELLYHVHMRRRQQFVCVESSDRCHGIPRAVEDLLGPALGLDVVDMFEFRVECDEIFQDI
jgi:hypothetical protein